MTGCDASLRCFNRRTYCSCERRGRLMRQRGVAGLLRDGTSDVHCCAESCTCFEGLAM